MNLHNLENQDHPSVLNLCKDATNLKGSIDIDFTNPWKIIGNPLFDDMYLTF